MYEIYSKVAPRPEDWTKLIEKIAEAMEHDFDYSNEIKNIKLPVMIIAGDADIFPPFHAVEFFELLGGGLCDGGRDGSGISNARLAILPGVTHYNIFMSPDLLEKIIPFLASPSKEDNSDVIGRD